MLFRKGGRVMAGKRSVSLSESVKRSVAEQGYLTVKGALFEIVRVVEADYINVLRATEVVASIILSLAVCSVVGELNPDKSIWVYNCMFGFAWVLAATLAMPYAVMVTGNLLRFIGAILRGVFEYIKRLFVAECREFDRY